MSELEADCKHAAGVMLPIIDRNRCEAKAQCVRVCPYNVFEVRQLTSTEKTDLSLRGKLKLWVHGGQQAFALRGDACHGCGLCVAACPERAITLVRVRAD